jgi:hypothetical protein
MYVSMLGAYSDELINTALSGTMETSPERLETLDSLSQSMGALVTESWKNETEYLDRGLRAAGVLACLPSLQAIAAREEHTQAIATKVAVNFRALSHTVLATPDLHIGAIKARDGLQAYRVASGRLSEIGVMGLLWWGMAHGLRGEGSYALPATTKEDSGDRRKDSLSLATDIVLMEDGLEKRPLQVKRTMPETHDYHPDITVVALSELVDKGPRNYRNLLALLSANNQSLAVIHDKLDQILATPRPEVPQSPLEGGQELPWEKLGRGPAARRLKHQRHGGRGGNRTLNP